MLYDPGLHIGIRHRRRCIHMGDKSKYRCILVACGCRNGSIDIAVLLIISDLCGAHSFQLTDKQTCQVMLLHGAGGRGALFTGLGIDLHISQKILYRLSHNLTPNVSTQIQLIRACSSLKFE